MLSAACIGVHARGGGRDGDSAERPAAAARAKESVALPAYPSEDNLIKFFVSEASDFDYFVDARALKVEGDTIYYTLVARSPEGVSNVSYEALRCSTHEYRIYAIGHENRTWAPRTMPWHAIRQGGVYRWHDALWRDYFCPIGAPILSAAEGIDALRRGRHPLVDRQEGR